MTDVDEFVNPSGWVAMVVGGFEVTATARLSVVGSRFSHGDPGASAFTRETEDRELMTLRAAPRPNRREECNRAAFRLRSSDVSPGLPPDLSTGAQDCGYLFQSRRPGKASVVGETIFGLARPTDSVDMWPTDSQLQPARTSANMPTTPSTGGSGAPSPSRRRVGETSR